MNDGISITGLGAVSPAGWGVPALQAALEDGRPLPCELLERKIGDDTLCTPIRRVPADNGTVPKAARLRRASPISKFAAAAATEALGPGRLARSQNGELRIGVIFTLTNGCVHYSNRFFGEVLADCGTASPILFPETVFNAPSSHISALIGSSAPNDTLIGDGCGFFQGLELAIEWLQRDEADGCLVIAAEEMDWLSAEGLRYYSRSYVAAEGAAAVYVEWGPGLARIVRLPEPIGLAARNRETAASSLRKRLDVENDGTTLLVDGRVGITRFDKPETNAWADWRGPRCSPRLILGEGMGIAAALQVVHATACLAAGKCSRAVVTATGGNQHAAGILLDHGA